VQEVSAGADELEQRLVVLPLVQELEEEAVELGEVAAVGLDGANDLGRLGEDAHDLLGARPKAVVADDRAVLLSLLLLLLVRHARHHVVAHERLVHRPVLDVVEDGAVVGVEARRGDERKRVRVQDDAGVMLLLLDGAEAVENLRAVVDKGREHAGLLHHVLKHGQLADGLDEEVHGVGAAAVTDDVREPFL